MADKKSTTKTTTSKSKSSASTSKKTTPSGPSYEDIVAARRAMEEAQAEVASAELRVRSARTIMSDFVLRDQAVAKAQKDLGEARAAAAAATTKFQELKYRSR